MIYQKHTTLTSKITIFVSALFSFFQSSCTNQFMLSEVPEEQSGINFINVIEDSEELNILDYLYFYNGGGVASGDINNDGLEDLFFISNAFDNKLYLNLGNLKFKDITDQSGIVKTSSWNTGVSMVDINNDGWLDIYVSAVVGINGFRGHNELYINQKDGSFKEESKLYNLDLQTFGAHSAFFDFDKDGDLDLYILNHGIHSNSNQERLKNFKNEVMLPSNDRLLENNNGFFRDITKKAGLEIGNIGYGLSVSTADINQDGWDDIYVSNDFFEDDYLYLNQKNGSFKESIHDYMESTSQFSMGNDIADLNGDSFPEIISLDMLPHEEKVLKNTVGETTTADLRRRRNYGYLDQFSRNHLQYNINGKQFIEVAQYSGIEASDWSWSSLFSDLDLDGIKDLFITNGIVKRPNNGDYVKYISSESIKKTINTTKLLDKKALDIMPNGPTENRVFKGEENLKFENKNGNWIKNVTSFSNGMVHSDLDNDGDLDIILNNINSPATILENKTNDKGNNFLKINFKGVPNNINGIGTKVFCYSKGGMQYQQLFSSRGYLSSQPNNLIFGLAKKNVDSLIIEWPNLEKTIIKNPEHNKLLSIDYTNCLKEKKTLNSTKIHEFKSANYGAFKERDYPEFDRERLLPYGTTDRDPLIVVADLNKDHIDDFYIGGNKGYEGRLWISNINGWERLDVPDFKLHSKFEDTDAIFVDIDLDGDLDLIVVSGGSEYQENSIFLRDRVYVNNGKYFIYNETLLPEYSLNSSTIAADDVDKDGDIDIFIGTRSIPNRFGEIPDSYLLMNNNGKFEFFENSLPEKLGFITEALFIDIDNDSFKDLWIMQEWGTPKVFKNIKGIFNEVTNQIIPKNHSGLWQKAILYDIDGDNDLDVLAGNIGLNSRFKASESKPLKMYVNDFDKNGTLETILANYKEGSYYPIDSKDKLESQLRTFIKKKFPTYNEFAGQNLTGVFGEELINSSEKFEVNELRTGYYENNNGTFDFKTFPFEMQLGPTSIISSFEISGKKGILLTGSKKDLPPYQGIWSSNYHPIFFDNSSVESLFNFPIKMPKDRFNLKQIRGHKGKKHLILAVRNDSIYNYKID